MHTNYCLSLEMKFLVLKIFVKCYHILNESCVLSDFPHCYTLALLSATYWASQSQQPIISHALGTRAVFVTVQRPGHAEPNQAVPEKHHVASVVSGGHPAGVL